MKIIAKLFLMVAVGFLVSCDNLEDENGYQPIEFIQPANFPELVYNFKNNELTENGFQLGKKLFYEGRLSSDGIVSCGFCHIQEDAFTHHGHTFSHGVGESIGTRNTPALQNLGFQTSFMFDGVVEHLDLQSIIPFTSPIEMDGNFTKAIEMMKADKLYPKLFQKAFPNGKIDSENMLKALGQFMVSLVSSTSRFDKYQRNESGGELSETELQGYQLFQQKCASCHATSLFTDHSFRNNGLPIDPKINDVGRFRVTEKTEDNYKFKVPSLRNIEKTAPYMHDGRLLTLEAVLNHYSSGIVDSETLDPLLKKEGKMGIELSSEEKTKIIAFLKTLTDDAFLTNKRFAEF